MNTAINDASQAPVHAPGASRARRSPRLIVLGALCALLGALGVSASVSAAQESNTVVAMAQPVHRGQVITRRDLRTVTVGSLHGVSSVPASQLGTVVGRTALVDLASGSLLPAGSYGAPSMTPGTGLLGLRLEAGRLPSSPLAPGTKVMLVEVAAGAPEASQKPAGRTWSAHVVSAPRQLTEGSAWTVDVSVPVAHVADLAAAAASGSLTLVKVA